MQYAKGAGELDFDEKAQKHLLTGLKDSLAGTSQISNNDAQVYAQKVDKIRFTKRETTASSEKEKGSKLVEQLLINDSEYKKTDTGLVYKVIKEGEKPPRISSTSFVEMHYDSFHIDDKMYESTQNGDIRVLPYKGIFKAWQEAFRLTGVNGEIEIIAPPELTYGNNGAQPYILPGEYLKFKIKFFKFHKTKPSM
jgi:FKBP-type peptidyl-prolyl cis-trans isomerase